MRKLNTGRKRDAAPGKPRWKVASHSVGPWHVLKGRTTGDWRGLLSLIRAV